MDASVPFERRTRHANKDSSKFHFQPSILKLSVGSNPHFPFLEPNLCEARRSPSVLFTSKQLKGIEGKREQEGAKPPKIETFVTSA